MIDIFKNKGIKCTHNRLLIYSFIKSSNGVSISDIKNKFDIDISTIYRIIHIFLDKEIIRKNSSELYFVNDHVHYFDCDVCNNEIVLNSCPYNNNLGVIFNEDVHLHGICKDCKNKKVGILVGSFNPITKAHIGICNYLIDNNYLTDVLLVLIDNPNKVLVSRDRRIDMIKFCLNDHISLVDCYNYFNYKCLDDLQKKYFNKLSIIIGSDQVDLIDSWDNYSYIKDNYDFLVINREGYSNRDYKSIDVCFNISSSMVRDCVKNKADFSNLVSDKVFNYIKDNNLYL